MSGPLTIGEKLASKFQGSSEPLRYLEGIVDTVFSFDPLTTAETIYVAKTLLSTSPGIDEIPMSLFIDNIDWCIS